MQKFCQNTIFGSSRISFQFLISKIQGSGFSFHFLNSIFQGSGFSFQFLKNYHDLTIFLRNVITSKIKWEQQILQKPADWQNFKARGPFGPLGFKTLPILGHLQNLLLPLYFGGNVSLPFPISTSLPTAEATSHVCNL